MKPGTAELNGSDEAVEEFNFRGRAECDQHHTPARLGDARQLADSSRHVRKEHDTELRPSHVEAVILKLERVAIHDTGLQCETLFARTRLELREHVGRDVRGKHQSPEPCRRNAERAAARRHVQKSHARAQSGATECVRSQVDVRGSNEFVVARREFVPRSSRVFCLVSVAHMVFCFCVCDR